MVEGMECGVPLFFIRPQAPGGRIRALGLRAKVRDGRLALQLSIIESWEGAVNK